MKQKFIEWFTKNNNGCSPAMEDDRSFVYEMTQHMFEAYQAGVAEGEARCAALAAENAGLKGAFDKPQAYLSWHAIPPTWEDPLPCGEYLDVHDEAGHKNSDGTDCWPVYAKPEIETPATDAFLAEVRAAAVDEVCLKISNAIVNCYQDEQVGLDAAATICGDFAAQLRKGVQS
ncbi:MULTISPECIES: hypothetical protein [Enterobacter cloacae complex]|uniref:hypothetical protein n=1 Tax=Enterobacter cloacae complex TaxID=354276 RepID=UPI00187279F8|nr:MULTISPECIES: hypothetical protein [Enterobacter cloacae complex]MBE4860008.1 hypothetical protein [Enterobacter cloacae complex sp. S3]BDS24410.1 hypothetical protein KAM576c_10290 [Enterobacter asburiae]